MNNTIFKAMLIAILSLGCLIASENSKTETNIQRVNTLGPTDPMVNPVDGYFGSYKAKRPMFGVVDDATFVRRIFLDLTGRYPEKQRAKAFLKDPSRDKRRTLIEEIMESEAYTTRWTHFLEDLFYNNELIFPPHFRNSFHFYLNQKVAEKTPWNELAADILTYRGTGYWSERGEESNNPSPLLFWLRESFNEEYRLDFLDDQTGFITQSMLGIRTECISCHDGAYHLEEVNVGLSVRKRNEFWQMAAFLAKTYPHLPRARIAYNRQDLLYRDLAVVDLDDESFDATRGFYITDAGFRFTPKGEYIAESEAGDGMRVPRSGGTIEPAYLFSGERPREGETRRDALARMIVNDRQFARNMVNRVWAHFFGEGFVEPLDGWDPARINAATAESHNATVQPKDAFLMERLTDFFIDSGYDIRQLTKLIVNSALYQADYASNPANMVETGVAYWASDRRVRRLEAEAIVDAFFQVLETPRRYLVTGMLDRTFDSVWHMPSSTEPNAGAPFFETSDPDFIALGFGSEEDYFVNQLSASGLLEIFGRTDRANMAARFNGSSIQIALTMLNDVTLHYAAFALDYEFRGLWLDRLTNELSSGTLSKSEVVHELFFDILFREPTSEEESIALAYIDSQLEQIALRDLAWALLNHPDFLYK